MPQDKKKKIGVSDETLKRLEDDAKKKAHAREAREGEPKGGPGEEEYRRRANLAFGGRVYDRLKGEGWDRSIPKAAAEAIGKGYADKDYEKKFRAKVYREALLAQMKK